MELARTNAWLYIVAAFSVVVLIIGLHNQPIYVDFALAVGAALLVAVLAAPPAISAVVAAATALNLQILVPVANIHQYGPIKYLPFAALILIVLAASRARIHPSGPATLSVFATLAFYVPATFQHNDGSNATKILEGLFAAAVPLIALVSTFTPSQRLLLVKIIVWTAILEGTYSYFEFNMKLTPLWFSYASRQDYDQVAPNRIGANNELFGGYTHVRAQGTLGHGLLLGLLVAVAVVAIWTMPIFQSAKMRVLSTALLAGVFVTAGTRTFLILTPLVLVLLAGLRGRRLTFQRVFVGFYVLCGASLLLALTGFFNSSAITNLLTSVSATHRASMAASLGQLTSNQPIVDTLFGNGYASTARVFALGRIHNTDGLVVVDNQIVSTVMMAGIFGLAALIWLVVAAVARAEKGPLAMLVMIVLTFFSFDVVLWPSCIALLATVAGLCHASRLHPTPSEPEPPQAALRATIGPPTLLTTAGAAGRATRPVALST